MFTTVRVRAGMARLKQVRTCQKRMRKQKAQNRTTVRLVSESHDLREPLSRRLFFVPLYDWIKGAFGRITGWNGISQHLSSLSPMNQSHIANALTGIISMKTIKPCKVVRAHELEKAS